MPRTLENHLVGVTEDRPHPMSADADLPLVGEVIAATRTQSAYQRGYSADRHDGYQKGCDDGKEDGREEAVEVKREQFWEEFKREAKKALNGCTLADAIGDTLDKLDVPDAA
jgi:flagellar biosynthesis/type III secretory pathway protein FliH